MKRIIKTSAFLLFSCFALQSFGQQVNFSIQAHEDDWQLFMSSAVTADIKAGKKIVCITLTAGDGGDGTASGFECPLPYYLAREVGSVYSSKFTADMDGGTPQASPTASRVDILGHSIVKYVYQNTVNYFLRLPDGGQLGNGSPTTGDASLQKLKTGLINSIAAIDGFTTYSSWTDLINTIRTIINNERGSQGQVWIYTPSLDAVYNPNDHSDHIYSAQAGQEAVNDLLWVGIKEFVDYYSAALPANLTASQNEDASAVFGICQWGLVESKYYPYFNADHKRWLPMDYSAIKRSPVGFATTNFTLLSAPNSNSAAVNNTAANTNLLLNEISPISGIIAINQTDANNKNFDMRISPGYSGTFKTIVVDKNGNNLFENSRHLGNSAPFTVSVKNVITEGGLYIIKTSLNGFEFETSTIILE
jgi:hypothetical protein